MTYRTQHSITRTAPRWALVVLVVVLVSLEDCHAFLPSNGGRSSQKLTRSPLQKVPMDQKKKGTTNKTTNSSFKNPFSISRKEIQVDDSDSSIIIQTTKASDQQSMLPEESTIISEQQEDEEKIGIWAARGLLLLIAVIWGTNFASVKYLETLCFHPPCVHPPSEAALARFGVAAAISFPLLIGQRKDVILGGLECGFWISLGYISQAVALSSLPAGKCAFICSLTVVVVPLLSAVLYGKPIKPSNLAAAAVALSGVAILEGLVDMNAVLGIHAAVAADTGVNLLTSSAAISSTIETASSVVGGIGKGDIVALGQPIGFGLAFMRIEHYVEKFKDVQNRVLTLSAAQCVTAGLISLVWVLYDFHGTIPNMEYMLDPHRVAAIAWTGIVTTVVAIYLEGVALQTATATDAALTFASEPVWASIFGVWLLHEHLNTNAYVGGTIILLACVIGAASDFPTAGEEEEPTKLEHFP